jgi:3',5'-cyclic AMP phosphodiesterase CpdA
MATGTVGDEQRSAAADALARPEVRARFRLVALHHPLLPDPSRPLDALRRLTDAERVVGLLRAGEVDLVVHGHNHVYKSQLLPGTRTPVIQVASGSRHSTGHMAEFNVYVVENGRLAAIERHVFDPEVDAFVSAHVHTADAA